MVSQEKKLEMFKNALGTRMSEEKLIEIYRQGIVPGHIHSGRGQEGGYAGTLATSQPGDYFKFTHRGVSAVHQTGISFREIYTEILGKQTGITHGCGGVNHINDLDKGVIGMSAMLGCDAAVAAGFAVKLKRDNPGNIVYFYMGDGTSNRGPIHEAMNLAASWHLPIIFICDNNQFAISTSIRESCVLEDPVAARGPAYGMPSKVVESYDIMAVYEAAKELTDAVRAGNGPAVLEMKSYRWGGHFEGDQARYRDKSVTDDYIENKDCVKLMLAKLKEEGLMTDEKYEAMRAEIAAELTEAVEFAQAAPKATVEDLYANIYAD